MERAETAEACLDNDAATVEGIVRNGDEEDVQTEAEAVDHSEADAAGTWAAVDVAYTPRGRRKDAEERQHFLEMTPACGRAILPQ